MQHNLNMTPAMQAVLDALRELGQANANELADKSGKSSSTVNRTLKTFADAGLIAPADLEGEADEGTPIRWTLVESVLTDEGVIEPDPDLSGKSDGADESNDPGDGTGKGFADDSPDDDTRSPVEAARLADTNEGVDLVDLPDTTTNGPADGVVVDDTDETDVVADADSSTTEDDKDSDHAGEPTEATLDTQSDGTDDAQPETIAPVPSRPADRKVMAIKGILAEYADTGATLDEIVAESGISHPTASRVLSAMEQVDAARLLDGRPLRWVAGPTKASEVDPNPEPARCVVCYQIVKGLGESPSAAATLQRLVHPGGILQVIAPDGSTHVVTLPKRMPPRPVGASSVVNRPTASTINADGNAPFARGELEELTFRYLAERPGQVLSPQEIANGISSQLGGREISSGAVRNNCSKLAATGRARMISASPWKFVYGDDTDVLPAG